MLNYIKNMLLLSSATPFSGPPKPQVIFSPLEFSTPSPSLSVSLDDTQHLVLPGKFQYMESEAAPLWTPKTLRTKYGCQVPQSSWQGTEGYTYWEQGGTTEINVTCLCDLEVMQAHPRATL